MDGITRFTRTRIGLLIMLWAALVGTVMSATASDARLTGSVITITGVAPASNCEAIQLEIYIVSPIPTTIGLTASVDGEYVTDSVVPVVSAIPTGTVGVQQVAYDSDRGLVQSNQWPLANGKPIQIAITLMTPDLQPIYEARAKLADCDANVLKSSSHGPAYQIVQNHSFEAGPPGDLRTADNPAAFWSGKNLNSSNERSCGSAGFVGSCGFLFVADPLEKLSISQVFSGPLGQAGDIAVLSAYVSSLADYVAGGKIKATITLTDGTKQKLSVGFPPGVEPYGRLFTTQVKLTGTASSAKVKIQQKFGTGSVAVDAVTLSIMTNSGIDPFVLPPPPAR